MRCNNCGWDNPGGIDRCEKCNAPLNGSIVKQTNIPVESKSDSTLSGTIKGAEPRTPYLDQDQTVAINPQSTPQGQQPLSIQTGLFNCPSCNASVRKGSAKCPYCSYDFASNPITSVTPPRTRATDHAQQTTNPPPTTPKFTGTIRPNYKKTQHSFTLTPLSDDGKERSPMAFNGEKVTLNRANLSPDNKTITSKEQATIELIDGKWQVTNKSELKTTFARVPDETAIPLQEGMVLLIGDEEFIFKTE